MPVAENHIKSNNMHQLNYKFTQHQWYISPLNSRMATAMWWHIMYGTV